MKTEDTHKSKVSSRLFRYLPILDWGAKYISKTFMVLQEEKQS